MVVMLCDCEVGMHCILLHGHASQTVVSYIQLWAQLLKHTDKYTTIPACVPVENYIFTSSYANLSPHHLSRSELIKTLQVP